MPTARMIPTLAAIAALVATLVGAANAAGPGFSDVLVAMGAIAALALARTPEGPQR